MILLHDYMEYADGGSRLCLELGRGLDMALLCGFVRSGHPFLDRGYTPGLRTLMPRVPLPLVRQWPLALAFAHGTRHIRPHDMAVYSGTYAPLAVRQRKQGGNILYCHTPPRFLYDQRESFARLVPFIVRPAFAAFCRWLRPQYEDAVSRMSCIIANSRTVQQRIAHFLGRESHIVYPPCRVETYFWSPPEGYYLSLSRLDHLKRVELLVRAFLKLPRQRLLIASDGPQAGMLRRLAAGASNIHFVGTVSETRLRDLLSRCIATLCVAQEEDFGMCAVESLAAGKPVIVAASGGLREIVDDGKHGIHLAANPVPEEVAAAVETMTPLHALSLREACRLRAQDYALERFLDQMRVLLAEHR